MPVIFCDVNLGDMYQTVYLEQDGAVTSICNVPASNLAEVLTGLSYGLSAYDVKLRGPEGYLIKIMEEVREAEAEVYGLNNIKFEVMV